MRVGAGGHAYWIGVVVGFTVTVEFGSDGEGGQKGNQIHGADMEV